MIRVLANSREPGGRGATSRVLELLGYGLPLLLLLYGFKCLATQQGTLLVGSHNVMRSFRLVPVHGTAALLDGLGFMALALFGVLSFGDPPPEHRHWRWRVLRGIARWSSLLAFFWCWQSACESIGLATPWPRLSSREDFEALGLLSVCFGIVGVLVFLGALFQREAVKRDIVENGGTPLHVWWRPAAYWSPLYYATPFRVIYRDAAGQLHKAYCCAYLSRSSWADSPFSGSRRVRWLRDEVSQERTAQESWVIVADPPIRSRLNQ